MVGTTGITASTMILFDWKKIHKWYGGSVREILTIVHLLTYRLPPANKKDPSYKYYGINFAGESFLVHPEKLFRTRRQYRDKELAEYIALASLRSYGEYKAFKTTTLDFLACKGKEDVINKNRLLHLQDDKVHFKYEEVTQEIL